MSKKRRRQHKSAHAPESTGVPVDEVLAEGSGPVVDSDGEPVAEVTADALAEAAADMLGGEPDDVQLSAASEPQAEAADVEATSAEVEADVQPEHVEAVEAEAAEPKGKKAKKGKRSKASSLDEVAAAVLAAEPEPDTSELRAGNEELADLVDDAVRESLEAADDEADEFAEDDDVVDADALALQTVGEDDVPARASEDELDASTDEDEDLELEAGEAATMPTSAASMDDTQLKYLVEALVFASDKPLTIQRLRQLTRVSDVARLERALEAIASDFAERGLVLQQVSGGYQFRTKATYSAWVQQLIAGRPVRLSRAQLETLAIVAYRQPITRPEIDDIRGVDSSATLKLLMDRQLIRSLGKKEEVGRPTLYGTTKDFLDFFSLGDLRELPTLREYSELSDESRRVMSDRLGIPADTPPPMLAAPTDDDDGSGGGSGSGGGNDDDDGSSGSGGSGSGGEGGNDGGFGGDPLDGDTSDAPSDVLDASSDPATDVLGASAGDGEGEEGSDTVVGEELSATDADVQMASDQAGDELADDSAVGTIDAMSEELHDAVMADADGGVVDGGVVADDGGAVADDDGGVPDAMFASGTGAVGVVIPEDESSTDEVDPLVAAEALADAESADATTTTHEE